VPHPTKTKREVMGMVGPAALPISGTAHSSQISCDLCYRPQTTCQCTLSYQCSHSFQHSIWETVGTIGQEDAGGIFQFQKVDPERGTELYRLLVRFLVPTPTTITELKKHFHPDS
jgi:hypothetical protein